MDNWEHTIRTTTIIRHYIWVYICIYLNSYPPNINFNIQEMFYMKNNSVYKASCNIIMRKLRRAMMIMPRHMTYGRDSEQTIAQTQLWSFFFFFVRFASRRFHLAALFANTYCKVENKQYRIHLYNIWYCIYINQTQLSVY